MLLAYSKSMKDDLTDRDHGRTARGEPTRTPIQGALLSEFDENRDETASHMHEVAGSNPATPTHRPSAGATGFR